jgi:hypothetical protein
MIKSLKKNDIRTTPFTAAKKWNPQNKLHKDLILWQSGSVSGSLSLTFKEYNDGTVAPYTYISSAIALQQQQDDFLRFREGVNLSGSISPTGSFYYDPVLSEKNLDGTYKTVLYATTKHLFYKESQDPSKIFGLESLDSSNVNRSLPNKISTFNIPQNKFGEKVIPKSVVITHEIQGQTYNVVDDGNSNLVVSDKTFINNQDANIDKIPANIILNTADKNNTISTVYDGSPKTVTATTNPSNLSYYITYNGSTTPPTDAGTYTIVATIDDNFYTGTINGTFIIEKAAATITISNVSQIYGGNPKSVTVVTVPSTQNRTVTYNGSTTPPTNVGKYNVVVTINDINYQGTQTVELNIAGNSSTISAPDFSKTYGDADFTIPLNTNSNGSVLYTITSGLGTVGTVNNGKIKIIGVGTIVVTITQSASGNYAAATTNCTITISQKPLTVTGITAADKVQNASSLATVNTTNAVLQGIIPKPNGNGTLDVVTLGGTAVGAFSDSSPGEGKTVTISGLTISGADASKYTVVQPTTTAAIKASSANGTITMTSATVIYNGNPQSLGVTIDPNIPIKITYIRGDGQILRVDRLYQNQITSASGYSYPKDIGIYNVTAELDNSIPTVIKYTVTTVTATLEIKPIQGNVTFGPNIFYYDGKPKPVATLSVTPPNKNLIITYNGLTTVPSAIGPYAVNVKFEDPNIFYNNTVTLSIIEIPTNNCDTNIINKLGYPQKQKNIIDLTSAVGKVNFNYSVGLGASQFTIEYPLNSGIEVYNSGLRSGDYNVGTSVTDYVSGQSVTVTGIQNNPQISFDKDKKGSLNGIDNDKCLITVYSPTNNNTWNYSISCVNASAPVIQPLPGINDLYIPFIDVFTSYSSYANSRSGDNLKNLIPSLKAKVLDGMSSPGLLSPYEYDGIINIINNNSTNLFVLNTDTTLVDTTTNIKVIVLYKSIGKQTTINLRYKRLGDSLDSMINRGALLVDCHWFRYNGTNVLFDVDDAKAQLISQINSDEFKDTFLSPRSSVTNGEIQRSLLESFVNLAIKNTPIDNARFEFKTDKMVIYDEQNNPTIIKSDTLYTPGRGLQDAEGILNDGLIYINPTEQIVEIIYPAICQPIKFGSDARSF